MILGKNVLKEACTTQKFENLCFNLFETSCIPIGIRNVFCALSRPLNSSFLCSTLYYFHTNLIIPERASSVALGAISQMGPTYTFAFRVGEILKGHSLSPHGRRHPYWSLSIKYTMTSTLRLVRKQISFDCCFSCSNKSALLNSHWCRRKSVVKARNISRTACKFAN